MGPSPAIDRLSIRHRPSGFPVMHQSWRNLLFMHWQLPPDLLRPHIPEQLAIDTFDGKAWIGVTPFVVRNARPVFCPPIPWLGDFHEINVRTYVHFGGVPGVWFFSLDAASALAVMGARLTYHLPYFTAAMSSKEEGNEISYRSTRIDAAARPVEIEARWRKGERVGGAKADSLEFFLVERYCLYALAGAELCRARIHHNPWELQRAELLTLRSTMVEGQGLPSPAGEPLLHYSERQDTSIWPLKRV